MQINQRSDACQPLHNHHYKPSCSSSAQVTNACLSQPQTAANSLLPQLAIDASKSRQSSNASVPSTFFADSRLWEVARTCNITTVNLLLHHLDKFLDA
ncbi:hypothetical protein ACFX15_030860 [Malus domestica]